MWVNEAFYEGTSRIRLYYYRKIQHSILQGTGLVNPIITKKLIKDYLGRVITVITPLKFLVLSP